MIVCCGEALIDFLPAKTKEGATAFQPFNGGSIYNVAIALGRLGRQVGYLGGISDDFFGQMLLEGLKTSQVDLSFVVRSKNRATTLAFVHLTNGQPQYVFLDEMSAGRMLAKEQIPAIPDAVSTLHFGSFSLIHDPAGATLEALAIQEKPRRIICIDPNIRASLVVNRDNYLLRLGRMLAIADIIKISDEDMEWIFPGVDPATVVKQWLLDGAALVILTRGGAGATAFTKSFQIDQPVQKVTVSDTVGAGDTFTAGLLASLDQQHLLERNKLKNISKNQLAQATQLAAKAAAITVSRAGANPPWESEI